MVWVEISLGFRTDLHVCHGGSLIVAKYRNEILAPYVTSYDSAIGDELIGCMGDTAQPY